MIAPAFAGLEAQLWLWMLAMIRPGAALLAAPIFGAAAVPVQLRIILSLAIGIAALNSAPFALPEQGLASIAGIALVAAEVIAGLSLGFALQIGYSAAFIAGETIANAMGLGFASMVDPLSGQPTPVVGRFLSIIATFLLLAMDGHLLLIQYVVMSYKALPPGNLMPASAFESIAQFGGTMFASGVIIALPVTFTLILVQLVMGMLARTAPSLNLFAVGLPATLLAGLVLLAIAAPVMGEAISDALRQGLDMSRLLAGG
ncbi:flagellar biosynthetic protein FliR [Sphingobium sp. B2D3A]|uniref:flagellar biosynthetic protein FliR n=1 Tax=Sphingobium TaxID=165695 RepID=UPI0015EC6B4C|nr:MULTISPECIES: flagellar biosynthetic protein FliR [Sphingobium]MCW2336203.1 flagellar biosynthetic protein FliR [Sphingobium sp. B2D3A]MCW2348657.1 flagellar biosynthetic protein FliR [Sphingobium sp. B12D2B]MCW2363688.1 flagellar biosynthetic protein FliR [Sphingobium sp. B10D3B]MCW2364909.1 flagellar biosynthetic protein FliR [Sphingobium sp. B7D2B]MCW2371071.1 flagellar biosynthetic protein FliR [Sphingobium sp. B11D3D]